MSIQLERLNRLFEFLVRVQEFWIQPWTRLDQLPWSSTLQTSSEGAPLRVAPSAPLFPALSEVSDLVTHEGFRLGLGLEWLSGPGADCPLSYREVHLTRVEADLDFKPVGPVRRRTELLRHLGLTDALDDRYRVEPCLVLFLEPPTLDFTRFFSRLKKAIQDVDDLPASLAYFTGPSSAKPDPTYRQALWSLPISPEQQEVVRRLAVRPLVVVEGGPGTGKSHLIANLLGHCLALDQRVLITGPTASALRPVLSYLPPELRDLCVGPDQDPETQMQRLLKRLKSVDSKNNLKAAEKLKKRREELSDELMRLEEELHDRVLREFADRHGVRVGDLGRRLLTEREEHGWIPGPVGLRSMPLSHAEVAELYASNRLTEPEERALAAPLPDRNEILSPSELASLGELWKEVENYPDHNFWAGTTPVEALYFLAPAAETVVYSLISMEPWYLECIWRARTSEKHRQTFANLLREVEQNKQDRARIQELIGDKKPRLAYADEEAQEVCLELIDHVNRGGTVTGIAATFLKPRWKKFLKGVSVNGKPPVTEADFRVLLEGIALRRLENAEDAKWAQEMILLGLMTAEQKKVDRVDMLKKALGWTQDVFADFERQATASGLQWERAIELAAAESGPGSELRRLLSFLENELEPLLERRKAYLEVCLLMKKADLQARYLKEGAEASSNPTWGLLRKALVDRDDLAYEAALGELSRWEALAPLAARRRELLDRLEPVAPAWVDALARRAPQHAGTVPPGDVAQAWEHRQAAQWLKSLGEEEGSEKLHAELARVRVELENATREMVALRAWAVQVMRLGKREPSPEDGLPAWIVPLDQVVERFSPDETRFDLLVIDHAALVDLRNTGLLALGQRTLVLGDPERMAVEPTAEPQELASLVSPFLANHPHARPSSLLHWLDQGDSLRLTQPFRSRPEMLHLLRALESSVAGTPGHPPGIPHPPVVLHRVRLDAVEISALAVALTREMPGQSLAVVSTDPLLARKVRRLLALALPPGSAPLVGSPIPVQGEQRDVVLVAMQDGERDVVSMADRRRLLTALGLAREQLWLLYSSDPEQGLLQGDLRLELINEADGLSELALAPGGSSWRGLAAQALKRAGFRMHPFDDRSVRVQGRQGWAILAMYGESGPVPSRSELVSENWLEQNLGWHYVRLRASRFWLDPEAALREVVAQLEELGLTPLEAENIDLMTLRVLKTAQELRREMPPAPGTSLSLVSSYGIGDFSWVWQPLVRRLLLEGVAVAPVDADGYAIEVERHGRRILVANQAFEDVDLVVDPSRLDMALSTVLEALGPAPAPLPRPPLIAAMAPGWEGPIVQAPVVAPEAVWEESALPWKSDAEEEVAVWPSAEPSPEPTPAQEPAPLGWETSSWMGSQSAEKPAVDFTPVEESSSLEQLSEAEPEPELPPAAPELDLAAVSVGAAPEEAHEVGPETTSEAPEQAEQAEPEGTRAAPEPTPIGADEARPRATRAAAEQADEAGPRIKAPGQADEAGPRATIAAPRQADEAGPMATRAVPGQADEPAPRATRAVPTQADEAAPKAPGAVPTPADKAASKATRASGQADETGAGLSQATPPPAEEADKAPLGKPKADPSTARKSGATPPSRRELNVRPGVPGKTAPAKSSFPTRQKPPGPEPKDEPPTEPTRSTPSRQGSAMFSSSGRFEFGAASLPTPSRPQRPAGEPATPGDRPSPAPPPPRVTPVKPAEEPAAQPRKPEPEKSAPASIEVAGRAATPGVRPPAPKSGEMRPGPPRTTFARKAPPKPAPSKPAASGVEAIRELMLQAFELIQPVSKETLGELVEGVNEVSLEKGGREQRRAPRLLCCYDVICETEHRTLEAVVSEVSLTGVRLELSERLSRDTIVLLKTDVSGELQPVRCQVKWCRRTAEGLAAGLAFHEEPEQLSRSWVAVLLHSLGFGPEHTHQRRQSLRVPTPRLKVQIEGPAGKGLGVALDLGVGGMLFESVARLNLEDRLQLTLGPHESLPAITVQARVANMRDRKTPAFGVAFVDLTPSAMKQLGAYVLTFLASRVKGKRG